ncbi:MAG TPA: glycosyltransferase, partial [Candidatus Elarobacter sp.]|nr:glycosyltransferase [Candidatus Elarobacter sp.]
MAAVVIGQFGTGIMSAARIAFWLAASLLFYVYAGYPLLLAFVGLFVRRPRAEAGYTPKISVLIAAYNEEEAIARKIQQTLALEYPHAKLEVLVLSDCSTDLTDEIVNAFPDSRVRLVKMLERRGKTYAQNHGVKEATGEVIIFSDATAIYHLKALLYLACNYQ